MTLAHDPVIASLYSPRPAKPEPAAEEQEDAPPPIPEHRIVAAHHFPEGSGWDMIDLEDENGRTYSISARRLWDELWYKKIRCYVSDEQGVSWLKAEHEPYRSWEGPNHPVVKQGEALHLYGEARAESLKDLEPGEIARRSAEKTNKRLKEEELEKFRENYKAKKAGLTETKMGILRKINIRRHGDDDVRFPDVTQMWARPWEKTKLDSIDRKLEKLERERDRVVLGIED